MSPLLNRVRNGYWRSRERLGRGYDDSVAALRSLADRGETSSRLLILDDIFPQMLSAFRIAEFNGYLGSVKDARVYSTAASFGLIREQRHFREVVQEYESRYPQHRGKVFKYSPGRRLKAGLIYTVFINNAFDFIPVAERLELPFAFTLYPGGGFRLADKESDNKLRRVFSSQSFRKVIVTQQVSYDYLVNERLCPADQIEFIFGGVLPVHLLANSVRQKRRFHKDKTTFDVCFVANKQSPGGVDKGFDIFVEVARQLSRVCRNIVFHVVGPFDASDIGAEANGLNFRMYGLRYTDFFRDFYHSMDMILSPTRASALGSGSFDGFPTGCSVEAGLSGVAVCCTDPLQQNNMFQDGEEIIIVQPDAGAICEQVLEFYKNPENLYRISSQGQQAFQRVFDPASQMEPRLALLSSLLQSG